MKEIQRKTESVLKRMLLLLVLMTGVGGVFIFADSSNIRAPFVLNVKDVDPTGAKGGLPRTPIKIPSIAIDDHTIYTADVWFDATLQLVDEDGEVVYTTFVPQGTPSVTLPSSLSGDYELQLLWGNWCFYGWINL